ncbi:uncharacterized protein EI90DRAFT_3120190 [Cantharellus anzutake]|uniref:uncharacterized protein n=1 Tax=Cantharellus anzutake TaxID=1750568 RepID=UPI001906B737|nr:uncharacterized protein EI90DRAFT_3120190 [Cantharellus anzutake]KAF8335948.1 hypothetical protein EI90DRAFT_3120190 [Cantharellus anzutake]
MARDPDGAIPFNSSRTLLDDIPPEYHWEGTFAHDDSTPHLGPFSRGYSPNPHISVGSVKPGQRIIEAVRIHGNLDLPRGQRAFIGFLDIPSDSYNTSSASSDVREAITEFDGVINRHSEGSIPTEAANNEFRSLMEKYGLPPTTHRNPFIPWPIRRLEGQGTSGSTAAQRGPHRVVALSDSEMMAPGEGWTTRGVMRIADRSIQNPRWTSCDIHFESRRELLVCRPGYVTTFRHLECFSLAA